jgi:hypothetical protein
MTPILKKQVPEKLHTFISIKMPRRRIMCNFIMVENLDENLIYTQLIVNRDSILTTNRRQRPQPEDLINSLLAI